MEKTVQKSGQGKVSRKEFFKSGSLAMAGIVASVAAKSVSAAKSKTKAKKRYAMALDLRLCTGCHACSIACKSEFEVPLGSYKAWVEVKEEGKYPNVKRTFTPRLCNHCENPPCVKVCPTGASTKRSDGIVVVVANKCIGCKACVSACPYNARFSNPIAKTADKCDFCLHRVENGVVPSCINTCPAGTRVFGDLDDPESEVSKLIARNHTHVLKPELGTKPKVYYIT